jgi:cytoskeleton protein RodZ
MPEIGATLREARMRQHIDISEIEARTKIRAKYLRALENEEWDLLPGPTFVKSFLRTYAEALGLDARLVLEEYKLRHERLAEHELLPIAPSSARDRGGRRRGPPPGMGRDVLVAVLIVALVGLLIVLGHNSGGGGSKSASTTNTTATTAKKHHKARRKHHKTAPVHRLAALKLQPTAPVWVCLQASGNRTLIPGQEISPSSKLPTWHSRHFVMTFGNSSVVMRINGKKVSVPEVSSGIGYSIDHSGHRSVLPVGKRPTCG